MERWILCSSSPWWILSPLIPCVTAVGAFWTVRFCSQLEWVWGIEQPAQKTPKIWSAQEFVFVRKTCVRIGDVTWPLMSPVQSGAIWVLFNGFPFCTEEEAGDASIMSMDTIHQSAACPLSQFQCGVKGLPTTCTSAKVVWSGISRLWLCVLDPSSRHHSKSDLKQVPFFLRKCCYPIFRIKFPLSC